LIDEAIRCAHLELSTLDWRFRERVAGDPRYRRRETFGMLDQPTDLLKYRPQPWPTFLRREGVAELAWLSVGISDLIRSIPRRVFGDDAGRIDRFYGVGDPLLVELLLDPPNGIEGALSRGDLIRGASGLRCIEWNVIPDLGGWETGFLARLHLANPATAALLRELGAEVTYHDTVRILFAHILAEVERLDLDPHTSLNVAFAVNPEAGSARYFAALAAHAEEELAAVLAAAERPLRPRIFLCRSAALMLDGGGCRLELGGEPVHAVVEMTTEITTQPVFRAFKAGTVALFNGPLWRLLSDKRNIALLSDESVDADYSREERELIRRYVPWTRLVRRASTSFDGTTVFLPEFAKAERERLVLKDSLLYGGQEVHLGHATPPDRWAEILERALATDHWVVQEYVRPLPLLFQEGDDGCSVHDVVWGPFVFGHRYAGTILRMLPAAGTAVVNLSRAATEGVILEITGDAAATAGAT